MLEHDLRLAIARDELRLVYQPQKEVQSGTVTGFEALLPLEASDTRRDFTCNFYPDAEETGRDPGDRRLGVKDRPARGGSVDRTIDGRGQRFGVQLYNANFVQELHQILLETGLSPHRLEIEIPRRRWFAIFNRALTTLRLIKALGNPHCDGTTLAPATLHSQICARFRSTRSRSTARSSSSVNSNGQAATIVRAVLGLARGLGSPCWPKASRPTPSFNSCRTNFAMRCRAICSDARPPSVPSAISRMRTCYWDVSDDLSCVASKKRLRTEIGCYETRRF